MDFYRVAPSVFSGPTLEFLLSVGERLRNCLHKLFSFNLDLVLF